MPLHEYALTLLNNVVRTEEDESAFINGYNLANDPANNASFGGPVDGSYESGVFVTLDDKSDNYWTAERTLPRAMDRVQVHEPAFVLGAIVAALEYKTAHQTV
jgi:hypothetical protein